MHITQNEIVAILLILGILWVWFTWERTTEGFTNLTIPKGKKWGDYIYYEDDNSFPVASPSITRVDDTQYKLPVQPVHKTQPTINKVEGNTTTAPELGAPFNEVSDYEDSLLTKMNNDDNISQESILHELPKSHDHQIRVRSDKTKQILTEKELMPGMEQKKLMEKKLEPTIEVPVVSPKPKKKKQKGILHDRNIAIAILIAVLLIGFVQSN